MSCAGCKKSKVSEAIQSLRLDKQIRELALSRAAICDKCDYLNSDLTCRLWVGDTQYIPRLVQMPYVHCVFGIW
jgi:predicted metal-binding protein